MKTKTKYRKCCKAWNENLKFRMWTTFCDAPGSYLDFYKERHPEGRHKVDGTLKSWLQFLAPFCPFCGNEIQEDEKMSYINTEADTYDDHTSVWGGAGPDCPSGRREAA
jgi:hypothetical protein